MSQGSLVIGGKIEAITIENSVAFHEVEPDEFSGYNIPTSLTNEWHGKTSDGKQVQITMNLKLNNLLDKIDLLSELPYFIRAFIQTFITAPFVYQWLEPTKVVVKIQDLDPIQISGQAFHECTFMGDCDI